MTDSIYPCPSIPYDDVTSTFIRDRIRTGEFGDPKHRSYVNWLVYVEWYATEGLAPNATGLSAACAAVSNWRIATKYPEAYDAVRRDCGTPTREESQIVVSSGGCEDVDERRQRARYHREQWQAVCQEQIPDTVTGTDGGDIPDRRQFSLFRFPKIPYHELESTFVRAELSRGPFDDIEHRRYVNRLVYLEAWARDDYSVRTGGYPNARQWQVAAIEPVAYDIINEEFGKDTREAMVPFQSSQPDDEEQRRYARQWRRVQEQGNHQDGTR